MVPITLLETELPIPPIAFLFIVFAIFAAAMVALLAFGKSRPHS